MSVFSARRASQSAAFANAELYACTGLHCSTCCCVLLLLLHLDRHRWDQNWNKWHGSNEDPIGLPGREYMELLTHHPCYRPGKDLVLPAFRPPPLFRASRYLGGDNRRERDILVLLRGDMGKGRPPAFSQGVRQQLAGLATAGEWRRRYNAWIGTPQELPGEQTALLSRSRYCLVVPLDGWSGTFEDAVLHGCIPVVVRMGKGVAQPFSALLRLSSGVLNIAISDLPDLPGILRAIPPAEEEELRSALGTWWHRIAWLTHPFVRSQASDIVKSNLERYPWVKYGIEQQRQQQAQALAGMGRPPEAPPPPPGEAEGLLIPVLPSGPVSDPSAFGSSDAEPRLHGDPGSSSEPENGSSEGSTDGSDAADGNSSVVEGPTERVLTEGEQVALLFQTHVWQLDTPVDDAFTTLMQVNVA